MKAILAALALVCAAGQVQAWEGTPVVCYEKVLMSAKLKIWKELVTPAKQQYEHRHGQVQLVRYPAVYKERVEVLEPEFYLLREAPCKH